MRRLHASTPSHRRPLAIPLSRALSLSRGGGTTWCCALELGAALAVGGRAWKGLSKRAGLSRTLTLLTLTKTIVRARHSRADSARCKQRVDCALSALSHPKPTDSREHTNHKQRGRGGGL